MAAAKGFKRLRLTRSIGLDGEHAERGEVHDVPEALAARLVGEGSAVHHTEEGEEPEAAPTTVNRMAAASNRDPKSQRVSAPTPKVKKAENDKD